MYLPDDNNYNMPNIIPSDGYDWTMPPSIDVGQGMDESPAPPTTQGSTGGSFADFLTGILGLGQTGGTSALTLPALGMAIQQWNQADRYGRLGERASSLASPISNEERLRSLARYRSIEEDPNGYLTNSPLFQAALRQGLNTVERSQAARGNLGSGEMLLALQAEGQDRAAQFVDRDLQRIRQDAGFQFDPSNAARYLMEGGRAQMESENAAMGALGFAAQNYAQGGQPTGGPRLPTGGGAGAGGAGGMGSAVQQIQNILRSGGSVNPNSPLVAAAIREMTGGDTPWNAGGYMNQWDSDGDGQVSWDEYTTGNNQDLMDQLTGGMEGLGGFGSPDWNWMTGDMDPNDIDWGLVEQVLGGG